MHYQVLYLIPLAFHFYPKQLMRKYRTSNLIVSSLTETPKHDSLRGSNFDLLTISVSPVFVYDGVEELSIPPAGGEVVAAQALVSLHHPLRPKQQLLFGRHVVRLAVHLNV